MIKTEWYPANIDPMRPGWYETRFSVDGVIVCLRFQDGNWYGVCYDGTEYESCFGPNGGISFVQYGEAWRGLTEPSNA